MSSSPAVGAEVGLVSGKPTQNDCRPSDIGVRLIANISLSTRTRLNSKAIEPAERLRHQSTTEMEWTAAAARNAVSLIPESFGPLEVLTHLIYLAKANPDDSSRVAQYMEMAEVQVRELARICSDVHRFAEAAQLDVPNTRH